MSTLPNISIAFGPQTLNPAFDAMRDQGVRWALDNPDKWGDTVMLDAFRVAQGDFDWPWIGRVLALPGVRLSLLNAILQFIFKGKHVIIYGPGIYGKTCGDVVSKLFDGTLDRYISDTFRYLPLLDHPQVAYCGDGWGIHGGMNPAEKAAREAFALTLARRCPNVMAESHAKEGPLTAFRSVTMNEAMALNPPSDGRDPARCFVWLHNNRSNDRVSEWRRTGYRIIAPVGSLFSGLPDYWTIEPPAPPADGPANPSEGVNSQ